MSRAPINVAHPSSVHNEPDLLQEPVVEDDLKIKTNQVTGLTPKTKGMVGISKGTRRGIGRWVTGGVLLVRDTVVVTD